MPRKAEITVYKYAELDDKVKARLRESYVRERANETNEFDLKDAFAERLEAKGYPTDKIQWSLSSSQGDGVAFYGKVTPECLAKIFERVELSISSSGFEMIIEETSLSHRYSHANTMLVTISFLIGTESTSEEIISLVHEKIIYDVRKTSAELEKLGYELLYPERTDEDTDEEITNLGHEYTADGKEFHDA